MNPHASTAAPIATPLPDHAPCPVGMGDWFASSLELQCGLLVTEWHLPERDAAAALPAQPLTH